MAQGLVVAVVVTAAVTQGNDVVEFGCRSQSPSGLTDHAQRVSVEECRPGGHPPSAPDALECLHEDGMPESKKASRSGWLCGDGYPGASQGKTRIRRRNVAQWMGKSITSVGCVEIFFDCLFDGANGWTPATA